MFWSKKYLLSLESYDTVHTKNTYLFEAYMEAGVMYFNRSKMQKSLEAAYKLNDDHEQTYKYIFGDKETWWLACCMTNTEFGMNKKIPIYLPPLMQFYAGRPFYYQKQIKIHKTLFHLIKAPIHIIRILINKEGVLR